MRTSETSFFSILTLTLCFTWIKLTTCKGTPPVIVRDPSDTVVVKNSPTTLKCRATGSPKPKIHWLQNGVKLDDDGSGRRFLLPGGSLHFVRVVRARRRTDVGIYQCVASNDHGTAYSKNVSLSIGSIKNVFRAQPDNQTSINGDTVVLRCSPPKGRPPPTVVWLRNNKIVLNNTRTHISPKGNLTISPVTMTDRGVYVCRAKHPLKIQDSRPAVLTVEGLIRFIEQPSDVIINEGSRVVLQCSAVGEPWPSIFWQRVGMLLPLLPNNYYFGRRLYVTRSGNLEISDIKKTDEGRYLCQAFNLNGDRKVATANLTVIGPTDFLPSISSGLSNHSVEEGGTVTFSCEVTGSPLPSVSWFQQDDVIPLHNTSVVMITQSGSTSHLTLINVTRAEHRKYKCVATSSIGKDFKEAELVVKAVVVVPGDKVTPTTKFNFVRTGGEASVVEAQAESGDTLYKMKMFIHKPWFIGTMGAVAWVVLLLVVVLLYRQRRNKRKAKSPTRVGVPADSTPQNPTM